MEEAKTKLSLAAISTFPLLHYLSFLRALKHLVVQLLAKEGSGIIPVVHVGSSSGEQGWELSRLRTAQKA